MFGFEKKAANNTGPQPFGILLISIFCRNIITLFKVYRQEWNGIPKYNIFIAILRPYWIYKHL